MWMGIFGMEKYELASNLCLHQMDYCLLIIEYIHMYIFCAIEHQIHSFEIQIYLNGALLMTSSGYFSHAIYNNNQW